MAGGFLEALLGGLAVVGLVGGITGFVAWIVVRMKKKWRATLETTRELLEWAVPVQKGPWYVSAKLHGAYRGFQVVVDTYTVDQSTFTRIRVSGGGLPRDLHLEREGMGASLKKVFVGADVEVGDPSFDDHIVLRGPADDLLPLFDESTRSQVMDAFLAPKSFFDQNHLQVKKGEMTWRKSGIVRDAAVLEKEITRLVNLAAALSRPMVSPAAALLAMSQEEQSPGVRARAYWELLSSFPDSAEAEAAVHASAERLDPAYGKDLGQEGILLRLLEEGARADQLAAIRRLAVHGSARAVVPLRRIEELKDSVLAPLARDAIAQVQQHLHGAQGGLSVVDEVGPAGALSLGQSVAGGVSLVVPEDVVDASSPGGVPTSAQPTEEA